MLIKKRSHTEKSKVKIIRVKKEKELKINKGKD